MSTPAATTTAKATPAAQTTSAVPSATPIGLPWLCGSPSSCGLRAFVWHRLFNAYIDAWRLLTLDAWSWRVLALEAWPLPLPRGPFSFFPLIWRLEREHMPSQQSLMRSLSWTLYQPNRPFTMVMTRSTKAALLLTVRTSRRPPWWRLVCVITNFMMSSIAPWRKSATSFRIFRPSSGVFRPPSPSPSRLWHQSPLSNPDVFLDTTITQKICIWQSPIVLTRATLSLCDRTVVYLNGAYKLLNGMMKRLYVPWY